MRGPSGAERRPSRTGWAILVGVILVLPVSLVSQWLITAAGADRLTSLFPSYVGLGVVVLVRGVAGFLAGAAVMAGVARLFPRADFGEVVFWQAVAIILASVLILLATALVFYIGAADVDDRPPWSVVAVAIGYVCGGSLVARFVRSPMPERCGPSSS